MKAILFGATGMVGQGALRECLLDQNVRSVLVIGRSATGQHFTLAAAHALVKFNPGMTFIYVSGMGTDSTERGRSMWGRVKGQTENALLRLPFKAAYMFRPGYIQPMHGAVSKTKQYRVLYTVMGPLFSVWNALFPKYVTTTEQIGGAMIKVVRQGAPKPVLENQDINNI